MRFDWDEQKNRQNRSKHGISFETARVVFEDPYAISIQDRHANGEERWQTIGRAGHAVILLVARTYGDDKEAEEVLPIISVREATPKERKVYEQVDR